MSKKAGGIDFEALRGALKAGYPTLLEGKHGTGKTMVVKALFDEEFGPGQWKFLSGATLDPWIDFVGVPHVGEDNKLTKVPPTWLFEVKAIFIDEYNRTPEAVRNAMMELIQFKTINGIALPKLHVIWAAVNPSNDSEYQVEVIDPAQLDRFVIKYTFPTQPSYAYFRDKFGADIASVALQWYGRDEVQAAAGANIISPRTLDQILTVWRDHGINLAQYALPNTPVPPSNKALSKRALFASLRGLKKALGFKETLAELLIEGDKEAQKKTLSGASNSLVASTLVDLLEEDHIAAHPENIIGLLATLPEKGVGVLSKDPALRNFAIEHAPSLEFELGMIDTPPWRAYSAYTSDIRAVLLEKSNTQFGRSLESVTSSLTAHLDGAGVPNFDEGVMRDTLEKATLELAKSPFGLSVADYDLCVRAAYTAVLCRPHTTTSESFVKEYSKQAHTYTSYVAPFLKELLSKTHFTTIAASKSIRELRLLINAASLAVGSSLLLNLGIGSVRLAQANIHAQGELLHVFYIGK